MNSLPSEETGTRKGRPMGEGKKIAGRRLRLRRGVTMDSGAANNVMPRRMVRNKAMIRESEASRRGVHYIAANNGRIPNEGEYDFRFVTPEGHEEELTMQIAEVNKALASISYLVDNGYKVTFDKDDKGNDMSMMMHKPSKRITRFRREKNVRVLDAMIDTSPDTDFPRPA